MLLRRQALGRSLVLGSCYIRVCILGSYSLGWSAFSRKNVDSAAVPSLGKKIIRPDVLYSWSEEKQAQEAYSFTNSSVLRIFLLAHHHPPPFEDAFFSLENWPLPTTVLCPWGMKLWREYLRYGILISWLQKRFKNALLAATSFPFKRNDGLLGSCGKWLGDCITIYEYNVQIIGRAVYGSKNQLHYCSFLEYSICVKYFGWPRLS